METRKENSYFEVVALKSSEIKKNMHFRNLMFVSILLTRPQKTFVV